MHGVTFPRNSDGWSRHQANTFLQMVDEIVQRDDFSALIELFAEDCVFRIGTLPEQQGRVALRRVLSDQVSKRQGERLARTCVAIDGNRLTIRWEGSWTDRETGSPMAGFGLEVWTMRAGKIVQMEATYNTSEQAAARPLLAA